MATSTFINTIIVIIFLCGCLDTLHAVTTLQLDLVHPPVGTPYAPVPNSDGTYDIPAGSNLTLKCTIDLPATLASLRYTTNENAEFPRFDSGTRARRMIPGDQWTLRDLKHYDTGLIECYNAFNSSDTGIIQSTYIFVYDASKLLHVPMKLPTDRTAFAVWVGRYDYVPCLPTHSETVLTVTRGGPPVTQLTINNTLGFLLKRKPRSSIPFHKCHFEYDGRTDDLNVQVHAETDTGNLPSPTIFPLDYVSIYLAGYNLTLKCFIPGYTLVQGIDWSYPALGCDQQSADDCHGSQDRVYRTEPRILPGTSDVQSELIITNLYESDSGTYTCRYKAHAQLDFTNPSSTKIIVFPAPFVEIKLKSDERVKKSIVKADASLSATVEAMPNPTIVWSFNNNVLKNGGRYRMVKRPIPTTFSYKIMLNITSATVADSGNYTLTASVQGSVPHVETVKLIVQVPPTISANYTYKNQPNILSDPSSKVFFQPDNALELQCNSLGGIPKPALAWHWQPCDHTKQCMVQEGDWTELPTSLTSASGAILNSPYSSKSGPDSLRLHITTVRSSWYRCTSDNGVKPSATTQMLMAVSALPTDDEGFGFAGDTKELAPQLVEDDWITLACYVSKFLCKPNEVEISDNANIRKYMKGNAETSWVEGNNSYILTIELRNITLGMDGYVYRCGYSGIAKSIKLSVQKYEPPRWGKSVSADTNITLGESKSFLCEPEGHPRPEVTWYKDKKEIKNGSLNAVVLSTDNYKLTINKATKEDSGSYSCVGQTRRSATIYSNFTLTVTDKSPALSSAHIAMIVVLVIVVMVIAVIVTVCIVRRYCRKKYTPHTLLLPSKEMINPDIPLDEQTDALPYDIGWEYPFGNLKLGMLLGQGAFGRVLKAEAMNIEEGVSSTTVAVKAVRDHSDIEQVKALISELKILIHLGQHLNIVNLLGACTKDISKGHILVIVEFCRYGNLRSYLLKHKTNFNPSLDVIEEENTAGVKLGAVTVDMTGDEDYLNEGPSELHSADKPVSLRDIMSWCYQIARGMEYLASIDYIHRDLAARNVLLADDNIVKICDFGLAKDIYKYQEYQKQTDGPLPIKWMALESLTHKVFNVRTDIWSYGVTVWELFSLAATPYPGWDIDDTFIDKLQDGYRMEMPKHCPEQIYEEVLLNCWHPDPEKRPNFAELAETMGNSVDQALKDRLQSLEDPYLRNRDSRTDITIRPSSVRKRDPRDLESDYLPAKSLQPKANGSRAKSQQHNYYNTSPTGSQPNKSSKSYMREKASNEEKMPLHVAVSSDEDVEIPSVPAPSPSPWERQSHLAKLANKGDDSQSFNSMDSDSVRPPSYHYVMKKSNPALGQQASSRAQISPAGSSTTPGPTVNASGSRSGSRDALNHSPTDQSYIETSC